MISAKGKSNVIYVTEKTVSCDGGNGASGHPKVYLDISRDGMIDCPYCGRQFILKVEDE